MFDKYNRYSILEADDQNISRIAGKFLGGSLHALGVYSRFYIERMKILSRICTAARNMGWRIIIPPPRPQPDELAGIFDSVSGRKEKILVVLPEFYRNYMNVLREICSDSVAFIKLLEAIGENRLIPHIFSILGRNTEESGRFYRQKIIRKNIPTIKFLFSDFYHIRDHIITGGTYTSPRQPFMPAGYLPFYGEIFIIPKKTSENDSVSEKKAELFRTAGHAADIEYGIFPRIYLITDPDIYLIAFKSPHLSVENRPDPYRGANCPSEESYLYASYYLDNIKKAAESYRNDGNPAEISGRNEYTADITDETVLRTVVGVISLFKGIGCDINGVRVYRTESVRNLVTGIVFNHMVETVNKENDIGKIFNRASVFIQKLFDNRFKLLYGLMKEAGRLFYSDLGFPIPDPALLYGLEHGGHLYTLLETKRKILCVPDIIASGFVEYIIKQMTVPDEDSGDRCISEIFPKLSEYENGDPSGLRRKGVMGNLQNGFSSDNVGDFTRYDNNQFGKKDGKRDIGYFLALCIEGDLIHELFDNILYLYNSFYRTAPGISVEKFLEEYVPRFMDFIRKLAERYGIYGDRDPDEYAIHFLTSDRIKDYIRAFGSLVRFTCGPEYRMCNIFEKEGRYVYGDVFRNPSSDKDIFMLYVRSPNYGLGHRRIIAEYREDYPKDIESELDNVTENIDQNINGDTDNISGRKGPIITGPLYYKIISRKITESIGITEFSDYRWNRLFRILYNRHLYRDDSPPERVFISDLGINTVWSYMPAVIPFVYLLNFSAEPSGSPEIFSEGMSILRDCVRWLISDLHRNYGIYIALFGGMIYTEYQIYAKNLAAVNILPLLFFDIINARSSEDYRRIAQFILSILAGPMNLYGIFAVLQIIIGHLKKVSDPFVKRMCNLSELLVIRYITDPLSEITEWKEMIEKEAAESKTLKIYGYLYEKMCSLLDRMGFTKKPIMPVTRRDADSERIPDADEFIVYKIGMAIKNAESISSSSEYVKDVKDGTEYPPESRSAIILTGAVRYWLAEIHERIGRSSRFGKGAVNKKAEYIGDVIYAFAAGLISFREELFYPEIGSILDSLLRFFRKYMTPNLFAVFLQAAFISVNCFLPYSFRFYPEFLTEFYDVFAYDLLLWFKFFHKSRPINNDIIFDFYDKILKKTYPSVRKTYDPEPYLHQIYSTFALYSAFLFGKDTVDYYPTLRFEKKVKIKDISLNELIGGIDFLTLLLHYITYVIDGETDRFKAIRNLLLSKYYPIYLDKIGNTVYYGADNISEFSLKLRLITLDAVYREILLTERFFYRNNFGYLEGLDRYYSDIKTGKIDIGVKGPNREILFEGFPNKDLYANIYDTYVFLYELIQLRTRLEESYSGEFGKKMGDFSLKFADISERIIFPEERDSGDYSGYGSDIEDIGYDVSAYRDNNSGNVSFGEEFNGGERGYLRDIIDRRYSDIEKKGDNKSDIERERFIRDKLERLVGDNTDIGGRDNARKAGSYFIRKLRNVVKKVTEFFRSIRKVSDTPNTGLHGSDTEFSAEIKRMLYGYVEKKERLLYSKYIYYTPYSGLYIHLLFTVYLYFYDRGDSSGLLSVLGMFRKLITDYLTVSIYTEIYLILLLKTILYFIDRNEYADAENLLYYIEELRNILDKRDPDSPILSDGSLFYSYKGAVSASPSVLHIARDMLPEIYEIVSADRLISPDMYDKLYEILLQTELIALYMFVSDGMDGDCGRIKEFVDKAVKNFYIKPDALRAETLLDIIKNAMNIFLKYSEEEYARYLISLLDDLENPVHDLLVERYYARKKEILEKVGLPLSSLLILEILERGIIGKSEYSEEESGETGDNASDGVPSSDDGGSFGNRVDTAEDSEESESGGENNRLDWEAIFRLRTLAGEDPTGELIKMLSDLDKIDKRIKETRKRLLLKILRLLGHKKDREKFSEIYDRYIKEYGAPDSVENTDDLLYILGSELLLYSDVFDEGYAEELGNKVSEILEVKSRLFKRRAGRRGIRGFFKKIFGFFSGNLFETELLKFYELGVPLYYYTIIKVYVLDNIGKEEREGFRRVIGDIKRTIRKYGVLKFYSRLRKKVLRLARKNKIKNIGWILKPLDALPEIYATALLLPTFRFPFDEKGKKPSRYLKELGKIYDKFDYNVYIANVYARGLLNLLYGALSSGIDINYSEILKKIAGLVRKFPEDPELRDIMEAALWLLYDKFKGGDLH